MKQHSTDELLKILNSLDSQEELTGFLEEENEDVKASSLSDFLCSKRNALGISEGELIRRANLQRTYGYQILRGMKHPGRDKVLSLCLALSLSLEDVQRALSLAGESSLYARRRRDSVLIFCINRKLTVPEANDLLYEMGEETLR